MRNDERLRTIYEVMAPYIVRNEHNWRDYLAFASQFHKHSFDNILLVYAQDEDVSILATRKQWAAIGRNLIPRAKGVAVCVYRNAKLTLDYLFDVSQTIGKEIHPTDWQLSDEMKKALTERHADAVGDALTERASRMHTVSPSRIFPKHCMRWQANLSQRITTTFCRNSSRKPKAICSPRSRPVVLKPNTSSF